MLDRIPIRWRLALTSAGLTFVILACFAIAIGQLTASRIRSDFNNEMAAAAGDLADRMNVEYHRGKPYIQPDLDLYAAPNHAVIRVIGANRRVVASTKHAPNLDAAYALRTAFVGGYRVVSRNTVLKVRDLVLGVQIQYARKVSDLESTVSRVRLFLLVGVDGEVVAVGDRSELGRRLDEHAADVGRLARQLALGVGAGEEQQVADEPAHALR